MESDHYLKLVGEAGKILRKEKAIALNTSLNPAAPNPFIRHMYTADPSAHVWKDGRLYVYASHDIAPPRGCDLMDRYHVFSTDDMVNWTDHGEILSSEQVPWGRKEGGFMWAPDCAYRNGTYYFYFPHPSETAWDNSWKIGVATSNKPAEGFKVQGYIEGMDPLIDPCVFGDERRAGLYLQWRWRHLQRRQAERYMNRTGWFDATDERVGRLPRSSLDSQI